MPAYAIGIVVVGLVALAIAIWWLRPAPRATLALATIALLATAAVLWATRDAPTGGIVWQPMSRQHTDALLIFGSDPLSQLFAWSGLAAATLGIAAAGAAQPRTIAWFLASLALFLIAVSVSNLLLLYVALELLGLVGYGLLLHESRSIDDGPPLTMPLTYHLAGYGLLAAVALNATGGLSFDALGQRPLASGFVLLAGLTGVARAGQFPFQAWLLQSTGPVAVARSSLQMLGGCYVVLRALDIAEAAAFPVSGLVAWGSISALLLLLTALAESRRYQTIQLLAASQIAVAIAAAATGDSVAVAAAGIAAINAALAPATAGLATIVRDNTLATRGWPILRRSVFNAPAAFWLLFASGTSLIGAPSPTLGFAGQLALFVEAVETTDPSYLIGLVVYAALAMATLVKLLSPPSVTEIAAIPFARRWDIFKIAIPTAGLVVLGLFIEAVVAAMVQPAGAVVLSSVPTISIPLLWVGVPWRAVGFAGFGLVIGLAIPGRRGERRDLVQALAALPLFRHGYRLLEAAARLVWRGAIFLEVHPHMASLLLVGVLLLFAVAG